jgi:hypothetical protein
VGRGRREGEHVIYPIFSPLNEHVHLTSRFMRFSSIFSMKGMATVVGREFRCATFSGGRTVSSQEPLHEDEGSGSKLLHKFGKVVHRVEQKVENAVHKIEDRVEEAGHK